MNISSIRRRLLAWYDQHRRKLPWRELDPPDPYATLVSETMLQQTQVATVVRYYERFMERFPTIQAIAAVGIDEVLPYWAGLGYYRRCHNLHAAAQRIVGEHTGQFPRDVDALRELPGIGRYTAGAVASIVFQVAAPAVDGNTRRVLSRVLGLPEKSASPRHRRRVDSLAERLVSPKRPGDFNQALMELGATICTPRAPNCPKCPIRSTCAHAAKPVPHQRKAAPKKPTKRLDFVTVAVEHRGKLLYRRRPDRGLWAGLWEWPTIELQNGTSPAAAARVLARQLAPGASFRLRPFCELTHVLTHRRAHFRAYHIRRASRPGNQSGRWLSRGNESELPMSSAQKKLLEALNAIDSRGRPVRDFLNSEF